jgi:hypothetical protein
LPQAAPQYRYVDEPILSLSRMATFPAGAVICCTVWPLAQIVVERGT